MKKFLCCVLVLAMITSCITVFADSVDSQGMEKALAAVKQKVEIPEKLTEFVPYTNEVVPTGEVIYNFLWQDSEGKSHLEVSCDKEGRINRYYFHDSTLKSDKKLSKLSKEDVLEFAEQFLRKTIPEAFSGEKDTLVFDQEMWSVNNLNYSFRYKRMRDGIEVKDNDVSVNITIYNDVPYIRNMTTYLKYDTEFQEVPDELDGYIQKYKDAFPIEIVYKDDARSYRKNINKGEPVETVLIYRHKDLNAGYILASNGEIAEEDAPIGLYGGGGGAANGKFEASADSAYREEIFTEQEVTELEKIENLLSRDKCIQLLKKIPHIGFDETIKLTQYNIHRVNEQYTVFAEFSSEDKERCISASFDGETGELLSLYNSVPYAKQDDEKVTEAQKNNADKKIDEFLEASAGDKLSQFSFRKDDTQDRRVYRSYDRNVNDVRYVSDSITAEYDIAAGMIVNYRMEYETERVFAEPDGVLESDKAYDTILELSPIKRLYVKTDGIYKVCYAMSEYGTEVDAFTGEKYLPYDKVENTAEYEYSDLEGHWAEEMINKLAEVQIGFSGEKFNPEEPIAQIDLLRLFAAGVRYKSYLDYSEEDLYREFTEDEILELEEKNPQGQVIREDAFKYMVRLDGLEDVAKLYEIFKLNYADGHLLTPEKTGYAAILTGMNIICGNDGRLRPDEPITRAEAAVMVYNYMIK